MIHMRLFTFLLALSFPVFAAAGELAGTAIYRERIALPPQAIFVAILYDKTTQKEIEITRFEAPGDAGPPYDFKLEFPDVAVSAKASYAIQFDIIWEKAPFMSARVELETLPVAIPMVRLVLVDPNDSRMGAIERQSQSATSSKPSVAAHGLALPATFSGTVKDGETTTQWQLGLWPDQMFQLITTGAAATVSSIGRWRADPTANALILHDGTENSTMFEILGNGTLQLTSATNGADPRGNLTQADAFEPADLSGLTLAGMMTYMADAAIFEDCLSGARFPIAQDGKYIDLEAAYLKERPSAGALVYVMFEGGIAMRTAMEGPPKQTVIVDHFDGTRPDAKCERQKSDVSLQNTYWRLDTLGGAPLSKDVSFREAHLVFEAGETNAYRATMGCNRMRGLVELEGESLSFASGVTTKMACLPPLMALENQFSELLDETTQYEIKGETLVFQNSAGSPLALFTAVYF